MPDQPFSQPEPPDTVTEVIAALQADGYRSGFDIRGGKLWCDNCGEPHETAVAVIERVERFEGQSDPDDEAIVFAMVCPRCGGRGTLVAGYGPTADPESLDVVAQLIDRR
jgi:hypothetical protein